MAVRILSTPKALTSIWEGMEKPLTEKKSKTSLTGSLKV